MLIKRVDLNFPYLQYLEIKASLIFMATPVTKSKLFKGLVSHCLNSFLISKNIIVFMIAFRFAYQDGFAGL